MAAVNSTEHLDRLSCTFLLTHIAVLIITLTWVTFVLQPAEAAHAGAEAAASEAAAGAEASKTEADSGSVSTSRDNSPFSPSHPFIIQEMWEAGLEKEVCGCLEKHIPATPAVTVPLFTGQT